MSQDKEATRIERDRQTQILSQAIGATIKQTMRTFDRPMVLAAAGALVWQQGYLLKQIPDTAMRKTVRKSMADMLPSAIVAAHVDIKVETFAVRDHKLQ